VYFSLERDSTATPALSAASPIASAAVKLFFAKDRSDVAAPATPAMPRRAVTLPLKASSFPLIF
jgi:hypothetical protein